MLVSEFVAYDENSPTGLVWLKSNNRKQVKGEPALTRIENGYYCGVINGLGTGAHRVVWYLHHGVWSSKKEHVDHIDGNRLNNKIENLRLISTADNIYHRHKINRNNKSLKERGIYKNGSGYQLRVRGKHIGTFKTLQEAKKVRKKLLK